MKGLLHGVGRGAWGHDLVTLGERIEAALEHPVPGPVRSAFQRLSRHYIPARYPDAHPSGGPGAHYGQDDVRQALEDAAAVLDFVDTQWRGLADKGAG